MIGGTFFLLENIFLLELNFESLTILELDLSKIVGSSIFWAIEQQQKSIVINKKKFLITLNLCKCNEKLKNIEAIII